MRKFIFTVTVVVSIFLFFDGIYLLSTFNVLNEDTKFDEVSSKVAIQPGKSNKSAVNILFMVKEKSGGNTDTMFLINYKPSSSEINVISIPRDAYYEVKGSPIPKINSAYESGGSKAVMRGVSSLLNVNIDRYVHINIKVFKQVIDLLGGIDFYVPADLNYDDPSQDLHIHLKKGMQNLDGDKAEQLLRFRKTQNNKYNGEISKYYDGSDLKREEIQKKFIKTIIEQKVNIRYIPKLCEIMNTVYKSVRTNILLEDTLQYISGITSLKAEGIKWFQLPGTSERREYWFFMVDKVEAEKITKEYFTEEY